MPDSPASPDIERLFRAVPGLFLVLRADAAFTIVAGSDGYLAATNADASIIGRPLFDVLVDDPARDGADGGRRLKASLERVLHTRRLDTMGVQRYDVRRLAGQGGGFEARHWLAVNSPVLSDDGEVEYVIHRVDDAVAPASGDALARLESVTEQQRLQFERDLLLVESERQRRIYETALDSTPDFVYVFDLQHCVLYANAALIKAWGVDEPRGKRWLALGYEPWQAERHDAELDRVAATGITFRGEITFQGPRGPRLYEYIFAPVFGVRGDVVAVAGTTRDITRRERAARRMAEGHRLEAIGTLAGGVAHDFNNMLAAILGNVALAEADLPPQSPVLPRLQLVHRAAERARSLVRQILTFTRRTPQEKGVLALQPLVDEAMAMLRSTLPTNVALTLSRAHATLWARIDAAQFQQVVVNLCTNAWQALGAGGGDVRVSLDLLTLSTDEAGLLDLPAGVYVRLRVDDNGHGIDESVRSRIFEPYFTTKPVGHGTGLGLAVVHGVVSEGGGAVRVESRRGQGTSISVYLPSLPEPASAPTIEACAPLPRHESQGERVLYVDDDEVVSLTAAALLTHAGYRVTCACDGASAMQVLLNAPDAFAVVVTDYSMPGMSGLDVAEAVSVEAPGTTVIIISGLVTDELRQNARRLDVHEVLPKEEMLERLVMAVRASIVTRQVAQRTP